MNLLLLEEDQFTSESTATLSNRQAEHINKILKLSRGDSLTVGKVNGLTGTAKLTEDSNHCLVLESIKLDRKPFPTLPITLILAMPRPQMLKRIMQTVACIGVEELHLIQTSKVEKSFWQSPSATEAAIREQLILGLEQGVATQLPEVTYHKRFIPFIEDTLPHLTGDKTCIIAHPGQTTPHPRLETSERSILAIGPEGGFTEKEVLKFEDLGFVRTILGQRILKVETAVTAMISMLYL